VIDTASPLVFAIGGPSEQKLAQVVTPAVTGSLTEVRFSATCGSALTVEVQGVSDGLPNGAVLATQTLPFSGPFPSRESRGANAEALAACHTGVPGGSQ